MGVSYPLLILLIPVNFLLYGFLTLFLSLAGTLPDDQR